MPATETRFQLFCTGCVYVRVEPVGESVIRVAIDQLCPKCKRTFLDAIQLDP